jgi:hypothetical protein
MIGSEREIEERNHNGFCGVIIPSHSSIASGVPLVPHLQFSTFPPAFPDLAFRFGLFNFSSYTPPHPHLLQSHLPDNEAPLTVNVN